MPDSKYCYPGTEVLINKLNIMDAFDLFKAEKDLTYIRVQELQDNPIAGEFDFAHLKAIHRYIFQDIYEWAGISRTVEIGKGNLFCTVACIQDYANSVFKKYFALCYAAKDDFDLSCTTHAEMLAASKISFNKGDSTAFIKIFSKALSPHMEGDREYKYLQILSMDDLSMTSSTVYAYEEYSESKVSELYKGLYEAKINKMEAEKAISDANAALSKGQQIKIKHNIDVENEQPDKKLSL